MARRRDDPSSHLTAASKRELACNLYFGTNGYSKDVGKALEYFLEAAVAGDVEAQSDLGKIYLEGSDGVERNYDEAMRWSRKAADAGNIGSKYNLAKIYEEGLGVPKDLKIAIRFYIEAAEAGDVMAQRRMGYLYGSGKGVPKDFKKSLEWYSLAIKNEGKPFYNQVTILAKLIHFCSLYQGEFNFSKMFLGSLKYESICSGLSVLFMISAYISKKNAESKTSETKTETPVDDLKHFKDTLDTLLLWDNTKTLSKKQQQAIVSMLYQIIHFQNPELSMPFGQDSIDRYVFLAETKGFAFQKEFACSLTVTQEQLTEKLKLLGIPPLVNRMVYITTPDHAAGLFEAYCYRPNIIKTFYKEHKTSEEMASDIFSEMEFSPEKTIVLSIITFASPNDPKVTYPSYLDVLSGCTGTTIVSRSGCTVLHQSARIGSTDSILYYLNQEKTNINARDNEGFTPLYYAGSNGHIDAMRLLLTRGARIEALPILSKIGNFFGLDVAERVTTYKKGINQLMVEKNKNLASFAIQSLITQGFITEVGASYLSPEERNLLELVVFIANKLNIPLRSPESKEAEFRLNKHTVIAILKQIPLAPETKSDKPDHNMQIIDAFRTTLTGVDLDKINLNELNDQLENKINNLPILHTENLASFQRMIERCEREVENFPNIPLSFFGESPFENLMQLKAISQGKKPAEVILKDIKNYLENNVDKLSTRGIFGNSQEWLEIDPVKLEKASPADRLFAAMYEAIRNPPFLISAALDNIPLRKEPMATHKIGT